MILRVTVECVKPGKLLDEVKEIHLDIYNTAFVKTAAFFTMGE
jgi:hypothetical protein